MRDAWAITPLANGNRTGCMARSRRFTRTQRASSRRRGKPFFKVDHHTTQGRIRMQTVDPESRDHSALHQARVQDRRQKARVSWPDMGSHPVECNVVRCAGAGTERCPSFRGDRRRAEAAGRRTADGDGSCDCRRCAAGARRGLSADERAGRNQRWKPQLSRRHGRHRRRDRTEDLSRPAGSQWTNNDPSGEESILDNFYSNVGGSNWSSPSAAVASRHLAP